MSIVAPIRGVRRDMAKHLEGCVYNPSADLESEHLSSSSPIRHRFPQSISNSDLSDVICTGSSPLLVLSKTPTTQNAMPFANTPTSRTLSGPCQSVIRLDNAS